MTYGIQSNPFAQTGPQSNSQIPSAPPLEAMEFATAASAGPLHLAPAPLDQALSQAARTVKSVEEDAAPVVVHQTAQPRSAQDRGPSDPGVQASNFELSSTDLILMQAQPPGAGGALPHGSDSCLDFLARCSGAMLRECGALLRSVDQRCSDLSHIAPWCNRESLCEVRHEVGEALGRWGDGGIELCTSILKCPVTTCSAICQRVDQMTCPSCPSCPSCPDNCSCDCNCDCCNSCDCCSGCDNCC